MHTRDEGLLREALRKLPEVAPPADLWARIERDAAAPGARPGIAADRRSAWQATGSLAAAATLFAIVLAGLANAPPDRDSSAPSIAELLAESSQLERDLAAIDYQRPLISGGTAATIPALEDRIALVDGALADRGAIAAESRRTLLDTRVQLLSALVHVRRAQAEPTVF